MAAKKGGTMTRSVILKGIPAIIAALIATNASAQTPGFRLIGMPSTATFQYVRAISSDGRHVTGTTFSPVGNPSTAFVWNEVNGRMDLSPAGLPFQVPIGISDDARVVGIVADTVSTPSFARPGRRIDGGPPELIDVLPGLGNVSPNAMSGDGNTLVGEAIEVDDAGNQTNVRSFVWSAGKGMALLPQAFPGITGDFVDRQATGVSSDGSLVVGYESGFVGSVAWRWDEKSGLVRLASLGDGTSEASAESVSRNGQWIVGRSFGLGQPQLVRWDESGNILALGTNPAVDYLGSGVSDDGNVIITYRGGVWSPETGLVPLHEYCDFWGVSFPADANIILMESLSADGRTFAGSLQFPGESMIRGFVVTVPSPSFGLMIGVYGLLSSRRRRTRLR
jgi:uncharacterized membrane protein